MRFPDVQHWLEVEGQIIDVIASPHVKPGTALIVPARDEDESIEDWAARGVKIYVGPAGSEESKP